MVQIGRAPYRKGTIEIGPIFIWYHIEITPYRNGTI